MLRVLRPLLRWAVAENLLAADPTLGVTDPDHPEPHRQADWGTVDAIAGEASRGRCADPARSVLDPPAARRLVRPQPLVVAPNPRGRSARPAERWSMPRARCGASSCSSTRPASAWSARCRRGCTRRSAPRSSAASGCSRTRRTRPGHDRRRDAPPGQAAARRRRLPRPPAARPAALGHELDGGHDRAAQRHLRDQRPPGVRPQDHPRHLHAARHRWPPAAPSPPPNAPAARSRRGRRRTNPMPDTTTAHRAELREWEAAKVMQQAVEKGLGLRDGLMARALVEALHDLGYALAPFGGRMPTEATKKEGVTPYTTEIRVRCEVNPTLLGWRHELDNRLAADSEFMTTELPRIAARELAQMIAEPLQPRLPRRSAASACASATEVASSVRCPAYPRGQPRRSTMFGQAISAKSLRAESASLWRIRCLAPATSKQSRESSCCPPKKNKPAQKVAPCDGNPSHRRPTKALDPRISAIIGVPSLPRPLMVSFRRCGDFQSLSSADWRDFAQKPAFRRTE
jgi:hypothetical protein